MVQGELFREESSYQLRSTPRHSFLTKYQLTLSLDKILLLLIAVVFTFTLSYSFGVEWGKRLMEKKIESLIPAQTQTLLPSDPLNDPNEIVESETILIGTPSKSTGFGTNPVLLEGVPMEVERPPSQETALSSTAELRKLGKFTVQLVTYDNKALADKEISRLKSKGYEGFIIPSGHYYQVCANYFETKSHARSQLEEMKQSGRYPDAYIRPVIR